MRARRKGATALLVALSLTTVGAVLAIVVDLGVARFLREQLQAGTDAAALAGARRLDGSATMLATARSTAVEVAGRNLALGDPLTLDANLANDPAGDVVLGVWDAATGRFTPETDPALVDAVQVRTRRDAVGASFALFFGREDYDAAAVSIAQRGKRVGAGRVPYYLPFSLPLCEFTGHSDEELMDMTFVVAPAGADTVGFGAIDGPPSVNWLRQHVDAMLACMHEWSDTGTVTQECTQIHAGDEVNLGNGAQSSSLTYLSNAMSRGVPWDTEVWGALPPQHSTSSVPKSVYGTVLEGPIPVFSGGTGYCTAAGRWTETLPVVGFVWGVIYDVAANGAANKKNVWVRLDVSTVYDIGEWSGGNNYGITFFGAPVLVW